MNIDPGIVIAGCCPSSEAGALEAWSRFAAIGQSATLATGEVSADIRVLCGDHYDKRDQYPDAAVLATDVRPRPEKSDPATDPLEVKPVDLSRDWMIGATLVTEVGLGFDAETFLTGIREQ